MLLPLNPSKRKIESIMRKFHDIVQLYNPNEYYSKTVTANFEKIMGNHLAKSMQKPFLAKYLEVFPLMKRLDRSIVF
jgi:hypothetical protein